jgi:hypothetical protein
MSAPTMKVDLPEVMTRPLRAASVSRRVTSSANGAVSVSFSTFMARPGMSMVTRPMPSASISKVKAWDVVDAVMVWGLPIRRVR